LLGFAVAASNETAFVGHPTQLWCGAANSERTDWMYQTTEHSRRQRLSVNATVISDHVGRYVADGSSLIINEVKASDAGIYICGHGSHVYHKLRLKVDGM